MSESIFASIIEEWADRDWASYADAPSFTTSKKHDRAMRRIFKRYERNTRKFRPRSEARVKHVGRRVTVALLVIILAALAGCAVTHIITQSFQVTEMNNRTYLSSINKGEDSDRIREKYFIPELPEGFELVSLDFGTNEYSVKWGTRKCRIRIPHDVLSVYKNKQTGQHITFQQIVHKSFGSVGYCSDEGELSEVVINWHYGAAFETQFNDAPYTCITWDNGDYIMVLTGTLNKDDLLDLAKSIKLSEEKIVMRKN